MEWLIVVWLAVMGAVFGSFACCQAWRIRARLEGKKMRKRSECMKCRKQLKWYENIPVFSWLWLRGKCRSCGAKIGVAEILMEILGALAFVGCYFGVVGFDVRLAEVPLWIWLRFVFLLVLLVILGVLAVYDGKWGELPTGLLFLAVIVAGLTLVFREVPLMMAGAEMRGEVLSAVGAVALSAGLYFGLSHFSRGKLMGDGDWLLGLAIGLALADWWLALILLAVSNLLAALFGLFSKKRKIYFGPFYVVGFVIVMSLAQVLALGALIGGWR